MIGDFGWAIIARRMNPRDPLFYIIISIPVLISLVALGINYQVVDRLSPKGQAAYYLKAAHRYWERYQKSNRMDELISAYDCVETAIKVYPKDGAAFLFQREMRTTQYKKIATQIAKRSRPNEVNVAEEPDRLIVTAHMTGMEAKDLTITTPTPDTLRIQGKHRVIKKANLGGNIFNLNWEGGEESRSNDFSTGLPAQVELAGMRLEGAEEDFTIYLPKKK